jgi:hypothetical protein
VHHWYEQHQWQNLPPVSTTLVANFSTTPATNLPPVFNGVKLPPVSMTPVANYGNNIRLLTPYLELEENIYLYVNWVPKVSKQNI